MWKTTNHLSDRDEKEIPMTSIIFLIEIVQEIHPLTYPILNWCKNKYTNIIAAYLHIEPTYILLLPSNFSYILSFRLLSFYTNSPYFSNE